MRWGIQIILTVIVFRFVVAAHAATLDPALAAFAEGLERLSNGEWDSAANAFQRAQSTAPGDTRLMLAHAVAVGFAEKYTNAVAELARMPKGRSNQRGREPEFWTYVFETMGGFATSPHRIGGARFDEPNTQIVPGEAVSMPGHMIQGGNDYPTDFASFVYYEMARNGYGKPRESQQGIDTALTTRLRLQAARWFAARFQASPELAPAHFERARQLNGERQFVESLSEIRYARIPYPTDTDLAFYTADNWLGLGRPASARREMTFALTGKTGLAAGYIDRAIAAAELGDDTRARKDLATATQLDAAAGARFKDRIEKTLATNVVKGDPLTLLANLEKSVRAGRSPAELLTESAAFHRAAGARRKRYDEEYQDRLRQLEAGILAKPKSPDPRVELAQYLIEESRLGRRSEAVEPRRASLTYRQYPNEGAELKRAVQLCDEALELDAKHVRASMQKATALSRLGRDNDAEAIVEKVLVLAPKNPDALRLRAKYWAERANGLSLEAVSLRTPRSSSSSHIENRSDGVYDVTVTTYYPPTPADLSRASQLDAAAVALYRRASAAIAAALEVTKGTFEGELLLADSQFAAGEVAAAEATLKKAIAARPQAKEAQEALADIYLKTGRADQADLQRSVVTQIFQTSAGWLLKQAWKKIVDQDFAAARPLLDQARKLDPEDARIPAYLGMIERRMEKAEEAKSQFQLALALEEGRLALDQPSAYRGAPPAHDPQDFGLALRLRRILAESASPQEALRLYNLNTSVARLLGPGGNAAQMFTAMLPEPGAEAIPVPAPANMATLLAESYVAAGKSLQTMGRGADAQAQFARAAEFGPKDGVPNIIGRNGKIEESNFAGHAGGQTGEAYMEMAKEAIKRKDFKAAADYMSMATRTRLPRERMTEANEIQMQIARGMRGW